MKVGLISLGCPKNLVDGEVMLGLAQQAGHHVTPDAADADVLVVNTCAFIDRAKQESIDAILEMAALKRPGKRLVVTGCLAERYREELKKEIPEIDALLGTGEVEGIVDAIGGGPARPAARPLTFYKKPTYLYDASTPRLQTTPRHFAYVKIAEGCDYTCAFCIIPTLRGQYRSRTAQSILQEARQLADRGVRELLLISQDTTFYGIDQGERGALARLLRELNAVDGLAWIRLLYLYPTTITDDVLDAMAECEKVCRYVDLPLQHASAGVLKRMRRPGHRRTYDALLSRIRARVPGVVLRTTFIVGFPGETREEFAELEAFVDDTRFDHVGVFTYSHEEGTRAFDRPDDVPAALKRRRRDHLMRRQQRIVAAAQRERMGTLVRVMIDGPSPEHELVLRGRLEGQAPEIDPAVYLSGADPAVHRPGDLIQAKITGATGYDLVAEPVSVVATV
ncbi:MAG TPA: 30S ribosomal protein S12 methylthiotransferase RimO [Vicinamibacterales bacterium]|nr:30S ribosomal protein S12 methylthiotransferase RimO [Vicinamibacterales bacterium]